MGGIRLSRDFYTKIRTEYIRIKRIEINGLSSSALDHSILITLLKWEQKTGGLNGNILRGRSTRLEIKSRLGFNLLSSRASLILLLVSYSLLFSGSIYKKMLQ